MRTREHTNGVCHLHFLKLRFNTVARVFFVYLLFDAAEHVFGESSEGIVRGLGDWVVFSPRGWGVPVCVRACVVFAALRVAVQSPGRRLFLPLTRGKSPHKSPAWFAIPPSSEGCREYHCIALAGGWMSCWEAACLHPGGSARA
ncbi:unnamed protein product [Ixodes pacificus]